MEKQVHETPVSYEKPVIRDYGALKDLTEATGQVHHTDVPLGTPLPPGTPLNLVFSERDAESSDGPGSASGGPGASSLTRVLIAGTL